MCKTPENKYKFSFGEMISSGVSGKTSATGTIGVILCLLAMFIVTCGVTFYFLNTSEANNVMEIIDKCIIMLGIGAALLGCRKVSGAVASKGQVIKVVNEVEKMNECSTQETDKDNMNSENAI